MTTKCASCGKFMALDASDLAFGARFHHTPLNEFSPEICEWVCSPCAEAEHARDLAREAAQGLTTADKLEAL